MASAADLLIRIVGDSRNAVGAFLGLRQESTNTMAAVRNAVRGATNQLNTDANGVRQSLSRMFNDVSADQLISQLRQGGQAGDAAAQEIIQSLNSIQSETDRTAAGMAIFGESWRDVQQQAGQAADSMRNSLSDLSRRAETESEQMRQALSGIFDNVTADNLVRELRAGGAAGERAAREISAALAQVNDDVDRNRRGLVIFGASWRDVSQDARRSQDDAQDELRDTENLLDRAKRAAVGLAGAFAGIQIAGVMDDAAASAGHLRAMLGLAKEEAEEFTKISREVYGGNFSESMREASEATVRTHQSLGLVGESLKQQTQNVLMLNTVFGELGADTQTNLGAIRSMTKAWEMDSSQATDLISKGLQGVAGSAGDLLDTLTEYPAHFKALGLNSQDALKWLNIGMENGAMNTDILADAVKEFGIRVKTEGELVKKVSKEDEEALKGMADAAKASFDSTNESAKDSYEKTKEASTEAYESAKDLIDKSIELTKNEHDEKVQAAKDYKDKQKEYYDEILQKAKDNYTKIVEAAELARDGDLAALQGQLDEIDKQEEQRQRDAEQKSLQQAINQAKDAEARSAAKARLADWVRKQEVNASKESIREQMQKVRDSYELKKKQAEENLTKSEKTYQLDTKNLEVETNNKLRIIEKSYKEQEIKAKENLASIKQTYEDQQAKAKETYDSITTYASQRYEAEEANIVKLQTSLEVVTDTNPARQAIRELFSPEEAERLISDFDKGGEAGRDAFYKVLEALNQVQDPAQRYNMAVALMGTQAEDLTADKLLPMIDAFVSAKDTTIETAGATNSLNEEYSGFSNTLQGLKKSIEASAIGTLGDIISPVIDSAGSLGLAMLGLGPIFSKLKEWKIADAIVTGASTVAYWASVAAMVAMDLASKAFGVTMAVLTSPVTAVIALVAALAAGAYLIYTNWQTIEQFFSDMWNGIKTNSETAIGYIKSGWEGFKVFFVGLWSNIWSPVKGFLNMMIGGVNSLIGGLNKLQVTVPDWVPGVGGNRWGINISRIPMLAAGGEIINSGLAIVGEKGPELAYFGAGAGVVSNRDTIDMLKQSSQTVNHTGTITVKGVNDRGQLIGVIDLLVSDNRELTRLERAMKPIRSNEKGRTGGYSG